MKLVCEKLGSPSKSPKKESKPGWEIRLGTQIENLRKQAKTIKQKKYAGILNKKEKATREKITVQLEKINQKVIAKEERFNRYRQRIK